MRNRDYQFNRYGEKDVRPGHYQHLHETKLDDATLPPFHWSDDPRSEHFDEELNSQFTGKGPLKGLVRYSDKSLRDEAAERLYRSWDVDATEIKVDVKDGVITLSGSVSDREQKKAADRLFDTMNGVHDVINQLKIVNFVEGWVPGLGEVESKEDYT